MTLIQRLWAHFHYRRRAILYGAPVSGPFPPSPVQSINQPPPQWTKALPFFAGATGNATSTSLQVDGYNGGVQVEIRNDTGGVGTATVTINGSLDGVHWYPVRYVRIDNGASNANAQAGVALTAAPFAAVIGILDPWTWLQAVISGTTGGALNCTVAGVAVPLK